MNPSIECLIEEINQLPERVPGIAQEYVHQLQYYLRNLEQNYPEPTVRQKYVKWYGRRVRQALGRAIKNRGINDDVLWQVKQVMRLIDEEYGVVTNFPIVEREVHNCIIKEGKVYRPEIILPDNKRIDLYEE